MDVTDTEAERQTMRDVLQRVIDDLLFYSDEIEMGRIPIANAAAAVRFVAALVAIQRRMT